MTSRVKKIWIWVGVVVIFLIAFSYYGNHLDEINKYFADRREAKQTAAFEEDQRQVEAMYRADFDGGKTPEETLDLFIVRLKANDAAGAAKYYELSVQPKALASLEEELKKYGNLELSVKYFTEVMEKGTKTCVDIETKIGGCTFEYVYITTEDKESKITGTNDKIFIPKGSKRTKAFDLGLNPYTKIWKIEQPY